MQERLIDLLLNRDLISVNQGFVGLAGGRLASSVNGVEVWGKPLENFTAAFVLVNRGGVVFGKGDTPLPPHCVG